MQERKRLPHYAELDGIRGLAALAVFFHHFFNSYDNPHAWVAQIAELGFLGVQVFFVLSGFLITALLFIDREKDTLISDFYWKRVLRIWPALLVYLCAVYLNGTSGMYVLLSLLFVSNFAGMTRSVGLGPTWTLAIEEQFYLIWPQVIRRFKVNTVFWLSFALYVLSISARTIVPLVRRDAIAMPYTPYQCDGLALGALLSCQWFAPHRLKPRARRIARALNGPAALFAWCSLALLELVIRGLPAHGNLSRSLLMTLATFLTYRALHAITIMETPWLSWLSERPPVFLGSISYGLYLYHGLILEFIVGASKMDAHAVAYKLPLALGLSIAVSYASLRLIELPVRGLRRYGNPFLPMRKREGASEGVTRWGISHNG